MLHRELGDLVETHEETKTRSLTRNDTRPASGTEQTPARRADRSEELR